MSSNDVYIYYIYTDGESEKTCCSSKKQQMRPSKSLTYAGGCFSTIFQDNTSKLHCIQNSCTVIAFFVGLKKHKSIPHDGSMGLL